MGRICQTGHLSINLVMLGFTSIYHLQVNQFENQPQQKNFLIKHTNIISYILKLKNIFSPHDTFFSLYCGQQFAHVKECLPSMGKKGALPLLKL